MSDVWKYFNKLSEEKLVQCTMCKMKLKFSGSTSVMWNHLKSKHTLFPSKKRARQTPNEENEVTVNVDAFQSNASSSDFSIKVGNREEEPSSESETSTSAVVQPKITQVFLSKTASSKQQEIITEALARMIAEDMLPLSFVEGTGFRSFFRKIMPNLKVPSRNTIKTRISLLYDTKKMEILKLISKMDSVALTTDCWTSRVGESYITVTLHSIVNWKHVSYTLSTEYIQERHTSDFLRTKLEQIIEGWELSGKVLAVVHDNAANIVKAIKTSNEIQESVCCFAHTLQLSIVKSLEEIDSLKELVSKCSAIVGHFKHSTVATNALNNYQEAHNMAKHKLIQSVKTRWNSTCFMIDRLIEQRDAVVSVLYDANITSRHARSSLELSENSWELLENLRDVLKPFSLVTTVMSSEKEPTISMVHPLITSLLNNFLQEDEKDLDPIRRYKQNVSEDLRNRFKINTDSTVSFMDICSFLDPRYKNSERWEGSKCHVQNMVEEKISQIPEPNTQPIRTSQNKTALDFLFPSSSREITSTKTEVDVYKDDADIDKNLCPLQWWAANKVRFPKLAKLAERYLAVPATSTPSERVFSNTGNIITAKRNCLKGKTVNMLVFLFNNYKVEQVQK